MVTCGPIVFPKVLWMQHLRIIFDFNVDRMSATLSGSYILGHHTNCCTVVICHEINTDFCANRIWKHRLIDSCFYKWNLFITMRTTVVASLNKIIVRGDVIVQEFIVSFWRLPYKYAYPSELLHWSWAKSYDCSEKCCTRPVLDCTLTLSQWYSSGNLVSIQCAWSLDHSVHWNATG